MIQKILINGNYILYGYIDDNYGVNLFHHTSKSNFEGYVPNPQAIASFLDLIRDPELVTELETHEAAFRTAEVYAQKMSENRETLKSATELEAALNSKEKYQQVEDYIKQVSDLVEKRDNVVEQKRQNSLPMERNAFFSFINRIIGRAKKIEEKDAELEAQEKSIKDQIHQIFEVDNPEKLQKDEQYAITYNAYLQSVSTSDKSTDDKKEEFTKILKLSKIGREKDMHEFVMEQLKPEKQIEEAKKQREVIVQKSKTSKKELDEIYEHLTPKAKELVDSTGRGFVRMGDIKSRYIENSESSRYGVTPFVSSLILETLMNAHNIKTQEDAAKYGICFTQEDVEQYQDKANKIVDTITGNLQQMAKTGENLER